MKMKNLSLAEISTQLLIRLGGGGALGVYGTHKKCRVKSLAIINNFDLVDIWFVYHPTTRQYTWHSNTKSEHYFLLSSSLLSQIDSCNIQPGFMSDHSPISVDINISNTERGKGYFKTNNSLLLQTDIQEKKSKRYQRYDRN